MEKWLEAAVKWLLAPETALAASLREIVGLGGRPGASESTEPAAPPPTHLWPRWIFLRALGLIYFSAFYSLLFQIRGLIGPSGLLPASDYLQAVSAALHAHRFWFAPTLLWLGSNDGALMLLCWAGLMASLLVAINLWPRPSLVVCFACFLSFVAAAQDFSGYQSDGMLLEAGFLALFFAPPGFWPGLGRTNAPSRVSLFLLQWEWFRIYFESGVVKLASGDASWRHFTAMDDYYQNGPLPTWIGWYVQHFPHWFHASTVVFTLAIELVLVWMLFLPRRIRIVCFCIVTPLQISIILTGNYTFLNYIVLSLGFLLLDDRLVEWLLPRQMRKFFALKAKTVELSEGTEVPRNTWWKRFAVVRMIATGAVLGLIFYTSTVELIWMFKAVPLPQSPIEYLAPFRIADRYGLFAVMTHARYELEFQGSYDRKTWIPYPFRYKPQDPKKAPGIYAPYQPRFDWNLWFASLGEWQNYRFVVWAEERLLQNDPDVLELFAGNPFSKAAPKEVRCVIYQYWFTDAKTKREQGAWWRREVLGVYAPPLEREPDGKIRLLNIPLAGSAKP